MCRWVGGWVNEHTTVRAYEGTRVRGRGNEAKWAKANQKTASRREEGDCQLPIANWQLTACPLKVGWQAPKRSGGGQSKTAMNCRALQVLVLGPRFRGDDRKSPPLIHEGRPGGVRTCGKSEEPNPKSEGNTKLEARIVGVSALPRNSSFIIEPIQGRPGGV